MAIFLLASTCLHAQWYDPEKVAKKAAAINEKAYEAAMQGNYREAINLLQEAIATDGKFVDAYLSRAGIHANMKNYSASVNDFRTAFSLDSIYASTYLLPYSISLAGTGNFAEALQKVKSFLTQKLNEQSIKAGNYRQRTYEFALQQQKEQAGDYIFKPVNLGENINSVDLEYFPSLTIDGKKMIFTRRVQNDEDFFEADLIDGNWNKAKPLGGKVNTNLNEGAQNISQDGEWLVFTGCNYPEGAGSCDLYLSYRTKSGGWSEPENIPINTEFWESSPSLSPDRRDLYFSSNAPGGFGGKDIWVTRRGDDGKWQRPQNLGAEINTAGDESCPFIHADNLSLYFNSSGLPGYGSTDLFLARKNGDSWATPVNLGYPINTIDDEGSLIVSADGRTGYFASDRSDTKGGLDLYSFELPEKVRASRTTWVKGKVFDKKTLQGLPSRVVLTDLDNRNIVSRLQTDEEGNYFVALPIGRNYAFNVGRKGYLFYSENYSLGQSTVDSPQVVNIPLQPVEAGAAVVLKNIFFDAGKSDLKPESLPELDLVVALMNENPAMKIRISGHTDNVGKPADNLTLSRERAKTVVKYLANKGIAPTRLIAEGFGETKPVEPNTTEEGKSRNRRTEMHIISN